MSRCSSRLPPRHRIHLRARPTLPCLIRTGRCDDCQTTPRHGTAQLADEHAVSRPRACCSNRLHRYWAYRRSSNQTEPAAVAKGNWVLEAFAVCSREASQRFAGWCSGLSAVRGTLEGPTGLPLPSLMRGQSAHQHSGRRSTPAQSAAATCWRAGRRWWRDSHESRAAAPAPDTPPRPILHQPRLPGHTRPPIPLPHTHLQSSTFTIIPNKAPKHLLFNPPVQSGRHSLHQMGLTMHARICALVRASNRRMGKERWRRARSRLKKAGLEADERAGGTQAVAKGGLADPDAIAALQAAQVPCWRLLRARKCLQVCWHYDVPGYCRTLGIVHMKLS